MSCKRRAPDRPALRFGRVVLEFFNNDDEEFKQRSLRALARELRKELNVSCLQVEDSEVENPERGCLVLACVAANGEQARSCLDRALAYLDEKAPARISLEEFESLEIP